MKTCFKCGELKSLDEFYKHLAMKDGHLNKCKECSKKDTSKNYYNKHDYYIKYERLRLDDEKRREARKLYSAWLRKNKPEKIKEYQGKYDKKQKLASEKLNNVLRYNKDFKKPCTVCGNPKSEGHHFDYNKPLDVIWLCRKHHGEIHRKTNLNK